jgi:CxxC motif-containing protein
MKARLRKRQLVCIVCPLGCTIKVKASGKRIRGLEGMRCAHGRRYARKEFLSPERMLTTTVRVKGGRLRLVPVRSSGPIAKAKILRCMNRLARLEVAAPVRLGQVLVENVLRSGADIIATRSVPAPS